MVFDTLKTYTQHKPFKAAQSRCILRTSLSIYQLGAIFCLGFRRSSSSL